MPSERLGLDVSSAQFFPYGAPFEEAKAAREAAVKLLWDKRSMLPEDTEEIVEDVLAAALPFFRFYPLGDNHHNAAMCPYCSPPVPTVAEKGQDDEA